MALMGYREILTMGSGLVDGRCPSISLSLSGNLTISWLPKQAETFSTGSTSELTSRDLSSFRNLGYSFCSKHSKHSHPTTPSHKQEERDIQKRNIAVNMPQFARYNDNVGEEQDANERDIVQRAIIRARVHTSTRRVLGERSAVPEPDREAEHVDRQERVAHVEAEMNLPASVQVERRGERDGLSARGRRLESRRLAIGH